ncbi:MAG: class III extradiol ring-cleavage dioxygenase [Synechococcales bacterium]|nr:class III extradiol ring-cleavage dioxygenase [Synechococcales bacterium]
MNSLPSLFLSHGAPDLPLRREAVTQFLRSLHRQFPKPQSILVISAHWSTELPLVSAATQPQTIYDFAGFPQQLYQLTYPAPGAPELAQRVVGLLTQAGIACATHPSRGFDHGTWTPLLLAYPDADVPVTQLSIQASRGPAHHWKLGQALASLRHEGVLIIGSGSATHNLFALNSPSASPPAWVTEFDEWLAGAIAQGDYPALLNYRQLAPHAQKNHPTEEHLLPLFVAMGAAGEGAKGIRLHQSYTYGVLSMAAFAFTTTTLNSKGDNPWPLAG